LKFYSQGDLLYVNFGTIEDFIYLNRTLQIDIEGKICISRYGSIFRGDKGIMTICKWCEMLECQSNKLCSFWWLPPSVNEESLRVKWSRIYWRNINLVLSVHSSSPQFALWAKTNQGESLCEIRE